MSKNFLSPKNLRWLTLYMLLALAVILFAVDAFVPGSAGTASGTSTTSSTTPTASSGKRLSSDDMNATATAAANATATADIRSLEPMPVTLVFTKINTDKLTTANPDPTTVNNFKKKVQNQLKMQKDRQASFVIAYAGADESSQDDQKRAIDVANEVVNILSGLGSGSSPFVFCNAKYDIGHAAPLYSKDTVVIVIYFLDASKGCQ